MDKHTVSPADGKHSRINYSYIVVAASFFIMTLAYGAQYSFGVFFKPMLNDFGWTRAAASGPFSVSMIISGILSIVAGRLSDRFGPKLVVSLGAVLLGAGYILMSRISHLWQFYISYGILVAIGSSAMYVPLVSMMTRWFARKRGLMAGIGISGIGFGIGVVPTLASQLIEKYDWRASLLIVGSASLILIVLLALLLKAEPETPVIKKKYDEKLENQFRNRGMTFKESLKNRQFWMLFIAWIFYGFFYQVGVVHTVPYATDLGMSAIAAAAILTVIGLTGMVGRICLGFIGDRYSNKVTIIISYIWLSLGFIGVSVFSNVSMLHVFAVIYGLFSGFGILLAPIAAEYFGLKALGAITGAMIFGSNIGGAISPTLAGFIFDTTGSYRLAFVICGVLGVGASVIMWLLKPAKKH